MDILARTLIPVKRRGKVYSRFEHTNALVYYHGCPQGAMFEYAPSSTMRPQAALQLIGGWLFAMQAC